MSVAQTCNAGVKVADSFVIRDKGCMVLEGAERICPELLFVVFPSCMAYAAGGKLPWENEKGEIKIACPDPEARVIVKLERI